MGFMGIHDWADAANAATVMGTVAAVLLGILAVRQYLQDSFLHQDTIANEKANEIYRLALAEPDLAEGFHDLGWLDSPDPERARAARKYLWFCSAIIAHLEYLYLYGRDKPEWIATVRLSLAPHLEFIGGTYHEREGWWETYTPAFRQFVKERVRLFRSTRKAEGADLPGQGDT